MQNYPQLARGSLVPNPDYDFGFLQQIGDGCETLNPIVAFLMGINYNKFSNRYSKEDFIQLVTRMKEGADINSLDVWDQNRIYRELYEQIALDQVLNLKWFNREGEALENPRQNDPIIQTMMGLQNNNHAQTANEAQDPQSDSTSSIHFEDDQKSEERSEEEEKGEVGERRGDLEEWGGRRQMERMVEGDGSGGGGDCGMGQKDVPESLGGGDCCKRVKTGEDSEFPIKPAQREMKIHNKISTHTPPTEPLSTANLPREEDKSIDTLVLQKSSQQEQDPCPTCQCKSLMLNRNKSDGSRQRRNSEEPPALQEMPAQQDTLPEEPQAVREIPNEDVQEDLKKNPLQPLQSKGKKLSSAPKKAKAPKGPTCMKCRRKIAPSEAQELKCGDCFHPTCIEKHIKAQLKAKNYEITCPSKKCLKKLTQKTLKSICSVDLYKTIQECRPIKRRPKKPSPVCLPASSPAPNPRAFGFGLFR
ncbi:unnamed protein product [Moneuplotes crassus]|uniref:Uncharacterized protein n=1 Tax=Euplotes crassus TaxID=5936 RepID=A0AAD1UHD6_EUPCR|nr:unnamed protein product [Moneuplotes crassus]